jgi:hypothetical protein
MGTGAGTLKRVMINNINCDAPLNDMPAIIAGIPEHPIEDKMLDLPRATYRNDGVLRNPRAV